MIAIALTGWVLTASAVFGMIAAEVWTRTRRAAESRRPPGGRPSYSWPPTGRPPGPTARNLAPLTIRLPRQGADAADPGIGDLVCLRCDQPVDYDTRLGLFCPGCEPADADRGIVAFPAASCAEMSVLLKHFGPDAAIFERLYNGTTDSA